MRAKGVMPFGCASSIPKGEHRDSCFNLSHGHRENCGMGLGAAWGGDTCGDTPPWGAAVPSGVALPALGQGLQTSPGGRLG